MPCASEEDEPPAAAEPESFDSLDWVWDCCCVLPDADPPALDCVLGVEADALPLAWLALELLPLALDGALPLVLDGALPLVLEGALVVPDGELPPDAFVEPEALPEPDDWLVCAP